MSAASGSQDADAARRRRRMMAVVAMAVIAIAIIASIIAVWLFFFGSEAPAAPTLDDALQVLQTTAPAE